STACCRASWRNCARADLDLRQDRPRRLRARPRRPRLGARRERRHRRVPRGAGAHRRARRVAHRLARDARWTGEDPAPADPDSDVFVLAAHANECKAPGETLLELATEAFGTTAAYEAAIATWFAEREPFAETLVLPLEKVLDLSYGENPHQRAAYYAERGARSHLLSRVEQLHGKALSFNNLNDLSAARLLAREFALPACVIVKHANPCGVAIGATVADAYAGALASDPTSAYGGVVVVNRDVDGPLGEKLADQFVEVLFAPGYDDAALTALTRKKGTRLLVDRERRRTEADLRHYKRVLGGLLVQDPDSEIEDREGWQVVCGSPDERQWGDLVFAWRVCKHVSSNAIVLA